MQDLGNRLTAFSSLVLKILIVVCALRAILFAAGVGETWHIPVIDEFITMVGTVLKAMSDWFFKLTDKHFSFK